MRLLSGMAVQVLVIGLLVFAYTQAARQVTYQRGKYLQLKEQVRGAEAQVNKAGRPDVDRLRAEILKLQEQLVTSEMLADFSEKLSAYAHDPFQLEDLQVKVRPLEQSISIPLPNREPFEVQLHMLELQGTSTTRDIAALLKSLAQTNLKILCPLESMELRNPVQDPAKPVTLQLRWIVGTWSSPSSMKTPNLSEPSAAKLEWKPWPSSPVPLTWGLRQEPFLSPFFHPTAIQISPEVSARFQLTSIFWNPVTPTCAINGKALGPGDVVDGYHLVVLTPSSAVLQKDPGEEIFLALP